MFILEGESKITNWIQPAAATEEGLTSGTS
jgi:hypothetical protein